MALVSLA
ncbi:putative membrane protein, partial [Vibrio parahaemolyticus Peru-288]